MNKTELERLALAMVNYPKNYPLSDMENTERKLSNGFLKHCLKRRIRERYKDLLFGVMVSLLIATGMILVIVSSFLQAAVCIDS